MTEEFYRLVMETPEAERVGRVFKLNGLYTHTPITPKQVSRLLAGIGRKAGVVVATKEKRRKDKETGKLVTVTVKKFASAHDISPNYSSDLPRWLGLAARGAFAELEMTWEGGDRRTPPFPHDQTGGGGGTLDCREDHPGSGCAAGARARTASAT